MENRLVQYGGRGGGVTPAYDIRCVFIRRRVVAVDVVFVVILSLFFPTGLLFKATLYVRFGGEDRPQDADASTGG